MGTFAVGAQPIERAKQSHRAAWSHGFDQNSRRVSYDRPEAVGMKRSSAYQSLFRREENILSGREIEKTIRCSSSTLIMASIAEPIRRQVAPGFDAAFLPPPCVR